MSVGCVPAGAQVLPSLVTLTPLREHARLGRHPRGMGGADLPPSQDAPRPRALAQECSLLVANVAAQASGLAFRPLHEDAPPHREPCRSTSTRAGSDTRTAGAERGCAL